MESVKFSPFQCLSGESFFKQWSTGKTTHASDSDLELLTIPMLSSLYVDLGKYLTVATISRF